MIYVTNGILKVGIMAIILKYLFVTTYIIVISCSMLKSIQAEILEGVSKSDVKIKDVDSTADLSFAVSSGKLSFTDESNYIILQDGATTNFALSIFPFSNLDNFLKKIALKGEFTLYNKDKYIQDLNVFTVTKYTNYQILLEYYLLKYELLTFYVNYGIYSLYKIGFVDPKLEVEKFTMSYGSSIGAGIGFRLSEYGDNGAVILYFEGKKLNINNTVFKQLHKNQNAYFLGIRLDFDYFGK